jgi:hypothetical protein
MPNAAQLSESADTKSVPITRTAAGSDTRLDWNKNQVAPIIEKTDMGIE